MPEVTELNPDVCDYSTHVPSTSCALRFKVPVLQFHMKIHLYVRIIVHRNLLFFLISSNEKAK